jgi:ADP-ribosylglycohydrolase
MRAAIIGVLAPPARLGEFVSASARLTHTDPRAEAGSLIVARLAADARQVDPADGAAWVEPVLEEFEGRPGLEPLIGNMRAAAAGLRRGDEEAEFARRLTGGRGVSGFVAHTVPVAVLAFFRHADDYAAGVEQVIRAGGDTDTTAAIAGALIGARVGVEGIPARWRERYRDWPWTLTRLVAPRRPSLAAWPLLVARNLAFFLVVIAHVFRRLLPPW